MADTLQPAIETVLVGVGEMGGVFAKALLRSGVTVHPVLRDTNLADTSARVPDPALVLVTVAEDDLHPVLDSLPDPWRQHVGLLQNELLPRDWKTHGIDSPTVAVVWFEKKRGSDVKVIISSPVGGPKSALLVDALSSVDIPAHIVDSEDELLFELVAKNCYILTANIAGLEVGGTVGELWRDHQVLARAVVDEVIAVQEQLAGARFDHDRLIARMVEAFDADPEHKTTGRSAPARLRRAIAHAERAGVQVPTLREIEQTHVPVG